MALRTRGDAMPYDTQINSTHLSRASRIVSAAANHPVQYNKAIVGKNAFAHESGIHQDGMLKHRETYEIMTPEDVGVPSTSLIMGKLSGRNAFRDKLEALGYVLEQPALNDAFKRFKDLADKKKHVFDEDIVALVDDQMAGASERISLKRLKVVAGTDGPQTAEIELIVDGELQSAQSEGNGPVDAVFNAIRALAPHDAVLELYQVSAVTEGTDAQATVSVRLADKVADKGLAATGKASDPDTLVASARAYVHALNKLEVRRQKARAA
jgi:2-isopropylmalate synthase